MRELWLKVNPSTPEEKELLQHQLQLLHAEALRDDKRKREYIRYELSIKDRTSAIVAEIVANKNLQGEPQETA